MEDEYKIKKFFSRLNGEPNFEGLKILDIGCGYGTLCAYMGKKKPQKVIGIDIDEYAVNRSNQYLKTYFPDLIDIVEFKKTSLDMLEEYDFDIIVSKEVFEHIIGLDMLMPEIVKRLKVSGKLYLGFGPLYNSYKGLHGCSKIPWMHIIRSEKSLIRSINKKRDKDNQIKSIHDIGYNQYSLKQYEDLLLNCGLKINFIAYNANNHIISKIFTQFAKINILREYFIHNIYCVMEKDVAKE